VLVILVAFGIIFIGVREFLYPAIGALGFGVLTIPGVAAIAEHLRQTLDLNRQSTTRDIVT
jgi:hypothetical protein